MHFIQYILPSIYHQPSWLHKMLWFYEPFHGQTTRLPRKTKRPYESPNNRLGIFHLKLHLSRLLWLTTAFDHLFAIRDRPTSFFDKMFWHWQSRDFLKFPISLSFKLHSPAQPYLNFQSSSTSLSELYAQFQLSTVLLPLYVLCTKKDLCLQISWKYDCEPVQCAKPSSLRFNVVTHTSQQISNLIAGSNIPLIRQFSTFSILMMNTLESASSSVLHFSSRIIFLRSYSCQ